MLKVAVDILTVVVAVFTLIPLIASPGWFIRIFDFPKIQVFVLGMVLLFIWIYIYSRRKKGGLMLILTALTVLFNGFLLIPFTPLVSSHGNNGGPADRNHQLKLLVANVYMDNREYHKMREVVKEEDPDLLLMLESDLEWENAMDSIEHVYPFTVKIPKDNTYGMHLYSKFPLVRARVKYWLDREIPSIHTLLVLPAGDTIAFFGIHPKPPVPNEDTDSKRRDAEILIVGNRASKSNYPVIVAGDFNDVAWSKNLEIFRKSSGLTDPRIGRAFYNTYHARIPFVKWPLDHVFFSLHFNLDGIEILPEINSDHYPMLVQLSLTHERIEHFPVEKDSAIKRKETEIIEEGIQDADEGS